ncbi:MAG: polyamine aminopropyltransferase [Methylocystaceae bacterium]
MDNWFTEVNTPAYKVSWKIKQVLHEETTPYQHLQIFDTEQWGIALVLDGAIQTTEKDEFAYHEIMALVPMMSHPAPERILIIGGGDGGVLREVLRFPQVKEVHVVEIDERVVDNSRRFLPAIACGFTDQRTKLTYGDGSQYVKGYQRYFDLVLVDSCDPVGSAVPLFSAEFYRDASICLKDNGMLIAQSESPLYYSEVFKSVYGKLRANFPIVKPYLTCVPTYVSGYWSFTCGSKSVNPVKIASDRPVPHGLKYYNKELHQAAFVLPEPVKQLLRAGLMRSDG